MSTPHSAGRTSWPPATGRAVDSLASTSRSKSEVAPGMAFSNVTALLSPSSPTTPWTLELQEPAWEAGRSDGSRARAGGSLRRTAHQEGANGLRRSDAGRARQPEKASHPHLEKASSWPHRRDAGRPAEGSGAQAAAAGEGASKHKGWHRQGVRRPSILPEGASGEQGARRPCQTRLCPAPAPVSILWLRSRAVLPAGCTHPHIRFWRRGRPSEASLSHCDAPRSPRGLCLSPTQGALLLCIHLFFPRWFCTSSPHS